MTARLAPLAVLLIACASAADQPPVRTIDGHSTRFQTRFEMRSPDELEQAGWWRWSAGESTFHGETATIDGRSYEEWMQRPDELPSLWWTT